MAKSGRTFADGEPADSGIDLALQARAGASAPRYAPLSPIGSVAQLERALSEPSDATIEMLARLDGDVMILGVGGKMGPSMALMVRRALDSAGVQRRVIGVSRFSNPAVAQSLDEAGVEPFAGDLTNAAFLDSLPDAENVIHLAGTKFGTVSDAGQTWAVNVFLPGLVANRFRQSRIVALSSGNVYGLVSVDGARGSVETDPLDPQGEYAMSVVGRERVFDYFSRTNGTRMSIVRLNYSTELRYGVLVDLALKVFRNEPVSLNMGYFNAIWQRDACEKVLGSLDYVGVPPLVLNITGPERLSCRHVCERFGELMDRRVRFVGSESPTALLSDSSRATILLGPPTSQFEDIAPLTADWIVRGGEIWNKPTQFEVRDGRF